MVQTPSNPYSCKFLFNTSAPCMKALTNWPPLYDISHPIDNSMYLQRFYILVWENKWPYELFLEYLHWNNGAASLHWTKISSVEAIWKKHPSSFMNLFKMDLHQTPISRLPIYVDHHNRMLLSLQPNSSPVWLYTVCLLILTTVSQASYSKLDKPTLLYYLTLFHI